MRYGKGTDLPGLNDPRGEQVGVIFVEPEDSHEKILEAILTQDKLDRTQIVIDLPQQNRAFQRPADFDNLKQMRRQIQGELIFITPPGPGPAELARQRRFSVFSSAESFVTDFLGVPPSTPAQQPDTPAGQPGRPKAAPQKKGWRGLDFGAFGPGKSTPNAPASATSSSQKAASPPVTPRTNRSRRQPETSTSAPRQPGQPTTPSKPRHSRPLNIPEGSNLKPASIEALPTQEQPLTSADQTAIWEISPALIPPAQESPAAPPTHQDQEIDEALPPAALPGPQKLPQTPAIDPRSGNAASRGAGSQQRTSKPLNTPVPIQLPQPKPKTTRKLAEAQSAGLPTPAVIPVPGMGNQTSRTPDRNTGKTVTVVNKRNTGSMPKVVPINPNVGSPRPPKNPFAPPVQPSHQPPKRQKRKRHLWLILPVAALVIILLLLCSLVSANPGGITRLLGGPGGITSLFGGTAASPATITITPDSKTLTDIYTFQGLTTDTPNNDARQVTSRQLTSTKTNQKQVNLTGKKNIPATQATGTLTFTNGSGTSQTIAASTIFPVNGVDITIDQNVIIPPADSNTGQLGIKMASAHAVEKGNKGNIAAGTLSQYCCMPGTTIHVTNRTTFTGGQDAQNYTFLQQSDVDNAFNEADRSNLQKATRSDLEQQVHPNEHALPESFSCDPVKTIPSVAVAAHTTATTATVTISDTCQETVFDYQGTLQITQKTLKSSAMKQLDSHYALQGDVTITKVQLLDTDPIFTVNAQGTWVYNWTDATKQALLKQLAGKTQTQAQALLKTYPGITQAMITLGDGVKTVPTDLKQISLTIKNGLSGPPTPIATSTPGITPTQKSQ